MSNVIKNDAINRAIEKTKAEIHASDESKDSTSPSYYKHGGIETWDYIIAKGLNYLEGNIVKYVTRWHDKNGVEDLKKARVYLDKLIEEAEKK
ncbi:DUF3310 domain-containing protein [Sporolactobacillus kofuensis]|uniref:DUF3310 domain-containing protein n=1 Tax=Sporolactobacillus kofuensis TaxID=269672 RepID=A0ABW1W9F1_9BACL|nr:DUF3310 domain-containing protein [Sporolactobacillus kofuensis]MCO7175537.1 DUF3310 domain-containing protein [Sporolactobacillus kofuensis]